MIILSDPVLGDLELRSDPFCVVDYTIGSRAPRAVIRDRALANGQIDDTRFSGGRAVTMTLRLNEDECTVDGRTMQDLYDLILPYFKVSRRPVFRYSIPGSPGVFRQLTVRGDDAPVVINGPKHLTLVGSFVAADGTITTAAPATCLLLNPAAVSESGRTYPASVGDAAGRPYDRVYPFSLPVGAQIATNLGNEDADWILQIFGAVTDPWFKINGVLVDFTVNGGLNLPNGSSVLINSRNRTIYLDGDPTQPRYSRTNFTTWAWDDLLLHPGDNLIEFNADVVGTGGQAQLCWLQTWAG